MTFKVGDLVRTTEGVLYGGRIARVVEGRPYALDYLVSLKNTDGTEIARRYYADDELELMHPAPEED